MKVEPAYPVPPRKRLQRRQLIYWLRWPFLAAALICPAVNLYAGGQAWSVVALWGIWMLWSDLVAPTMVEYNRVSQLTRLLSQSCCLLLLIDLLLAPGRIRALLPIVCFGGLAVVATLFFTDYDRQRQNVTPLMLLCAVAFLSSAVCLIVTAWEHRWALIVMGALSLSLLVACGVSLGGGFLRGIQKYFHLK